MSFFPVCCATLSMFAIIALLSIAAVLGNCVRVFTCKHKFFNVGTQSMAIPIQLVLSLFILLFLVSIFPFTFNYRRTGRNILNVLSMPPVKALSNFCLCCGPMCSTKSWITPACDFVFLVAYFVFFLSSLAYLLRERRKGNSYDICSTVSFVLKLSSEFSQRRNGRGGHAAKTEYLHPSNTIAVLFKNVHILVYYYNVFILARFFSSHEHFCLSLQFSLSYVLLILYYRIIFIVLAQIHIMFFQMNGSTGYRLLDPSKNSDHKKSWSVLACVFIQGRKDIILIHFWVRNILRSTKHLRGVTLNNHHLYSYSSSI